MAITFRRGPRTLVNEINRAGYRIVEITSDIGDLSRCVQISLKNGALVNWDRDSHSVWANGPQPLSEKIEAYLASQRGKHKPRKTLSVVSISATAVLIGCLLLGLLWESTSSQQSVPNALPSSTSNATDAP
jgi:hypothetical protein